MSRVTRLCFLLTLTFLLNGCDEWDDLVDSISGSGDDNSKAVEETTVTNAKIAETPVVKSAPKVSGYATKFHHTATGSSDGGKSLVLCPGQVTNFENCSVGTVDIPYHGLDDGRVIYWNMREEPRGDIVCVKNGKGYRFKADAQIVRGNCS